MTLTIYGRAAWGARYPDGDAAAPLPVREVWLHHSATYGPPIESDFDTDVAAVRHLEQIGQDRFGSGISYTFLVLPSGRVFAGHSVNRRGTHTGGRNSTSRAVCLVGNYETSRPTDPQVSAVAELLALGELNGWWLAPVLAGGHRDLKATACPGRYAYALIPVMNSRAAHGTAQEELQMLTDHQAAQLDTALTQLTGSKEPWTFTGWDEFEVPPAVDLTLVDLVRRVLAQNRDDHQLLAQLVAEVQEVKAAVVKLAVGGVDYDVLAAALADELLGRLAAAGTEGSE